MDCKTCRQRIEAGLEEILDAATRRAVRDHLRACSACRAIEVTARAAAPPPVKPPPGLAESILVRTSGSPCAVASEQLGDHLDGTLAATEQELLRLHLEHCGDCATLARALARLSEELPALAELRPDDRFVDDVLAATRPSPVLVGRRVVSLREAWASWLRRPRFALEGAYLGTLLLALVFVTPGSPLAGVPERALELARVNPVEGIEPAAAQLQVRASSSVHAALERTGAWFGGLGRAVADRAARWSRDATGKVHEKLGTLWAPDASEQDDGGPPGEETKR